MPMQSVELAIEEMRYAREALGMRGGFLRPNPYHGKQDDQRPVPSAQRVSTVMRPGYPLTLRINSAQRSSTGKVFAAGSGGKVVTTLATPMSR
jgi:hypothetical protein